MEESKSFWEKLKNIWLKIVHFKGTKYIVVLGIAAIVFILVAVKSNAVLVLEGTSRENEKVVFVAVENSSYYYKGSDREKNADGSYKEDTIKDFHEVWYVVEGYSSKASYSNGDAAIFNSDRDQDTVLDKARKSVSKIIPYHFTNEQITSNNATGYEHLITNVCRVREEEQVRPNGTTWMKKVQYRPTVWYQLSATEISKLESYTYSTFIELTKYQQLFNVNYIRVTFKLNDNETKFLDDFEI